MTRLLAAILLAVTAFAQGPGPAPGAQVKPDARDTIRASAYADNWFMMYINGKLAAVDPIDFLPHNQVNVDILPEYPMTIAILAKDNADPRTGLEYGDRIGDAGFILKFADGTVTSSQWKARSFFHGPLDRDIVNPKVRYDPIPANWYAPDFNDSAWDSATEYPADRVRADGIVVSDFTGAKFIWTSDLDLDNTVIFRYRVEKPGWKARWNVSPELDNTCIFTAPAKCPCVAEPTKEGQ